MARAIAAHLTGTTPSIVAGYNSIAFDELFVRQALYETLQPVFATQTRGNARLDVMTMAQAAAIYAPGALDIPCVEGRLRFKLENLAAANGHPIHRAHDALEDVHAALHIARRIRQRAPEVWSSTMKLSNRHAVHAFLHNNPVLCWSAIFFGAPVSEIVTRVCTSPGGATVALFNLAADPAPHLDKSVSEIAAMLDARPRLIRLINANAQPILAPCDRSPAAMGARLPTAIYEARARRIASHPRFRANVAEAMRRLSVGARLPRYADERIDDCFPSQLDAEICRVFHDRAWDDRYELATAIGDERLREFAFRLIFAERPAALPASERARLTAWHLNRLRGDAAIPWLTPTASRRILDLSDAATLNQRSRLAIAARTGRLRSIDVASPKPRATNRKVGRAAGAA
jgi:exodeoxyribonuclease-1